MARPLASYGRDRTLHTGSVRSRLGAVVQTLSKKATALLIAPFVALVPVVMTGGPAEAAPPARIKGFVTAPGGVPLAGIHVSTLHWQEDLDQWIEADSDTSGVDGRYNVGKLVSGIYRVRYYDPSGSLATEFYRDQARAADADPIDVSVGVHELAPTELGGAAHLTGKVTGSNGAGIDRAVVTAYVSQDAEWISFQSVVTGADGSYDLGGLPGGSYTLGFRDPATGITEFWNDKAVLADAHTLNVQSQGVTDGLDAQLATPLEPTPVPTVTQGSTSTTSSTSSTSSTTTTTASPASAATAKKTIRVLKKPVIKGVAKVGNRLRVTPGKINPTAVVRKIQWLAAGKVIKKATKRRFRVTNKQRGKKLTVRITISAPGYTTLVVKTKRTPRVKRA
jgi:hypothetical protein